jgi:hypothetical protein
MEFVEAEYWPAVQFVHTVLALATHALVTSLPAAHTVQAEQGA